MHSKSANTTHTSQIKHSHGALLRVHTNAPNDVYRDESGGFKCQLQSHDRYCKKYNYTCYFMGDKPDWKEERNMRGLKFGGWVKIQAIREILSLHPWVLYLDVDAVFENPEAAPSIEKLLHDDDKRGIAVNLPGGVHGWSTDTMFVRNTPYGHAFIDRIWDLRHNCKNFHAEQGAAHVAMFDAMIEHEYHNLMTSTREDVKVSVKNDQGNNCCVPLKLCEFPHGENKPKNLDSERMSGPYPVGFSIQGCTWNWQHALGHLPGGSPISKRLHQRLSWNVDMRQELNISHPVKLLFC